MDKLGDKAAEIVDRWAWWQTALKEPDLIGTETLPIHESEPQQGYYRCRIKTGDWQPVAIWFDEETGSWLGYRDGKEPRDINELWIWACRNPVTFEAYEKALAGGGWDDEPKKAAGIGDNSGEADPFEALKIELSGEIENAEEFLKKEIKTKADADRVGIWSTKIRALGSRAEDLRKVEKQPHLDAGRAVDAKWRELTDLATDATTKLKKHLEPYLKEQARIERERVERERAEAERLRKEAAEKLKEDADAAEDLIRKAEEADKASQQRKAHAGRTGAKVGLREVQVGKVTDYEKAALALVRMPHKDILELIDQLANRAARSGMPFEGMEIKTEERVQ